MAIEKIWPSSDDEVTGLAPRPVSAHQVLFMKMAFQQAGLIRSDSVCACF
jgi:hypothetical protein